MIEIEEISRNVLAGRARETADLVGRALDGNYAVETILREGLMPGMASAEKQWGRKPPGAPEMLLAVRAMNAGLKILRASPELGAAECWGTVIIGTVQEDLYDVEKNIMALMMRIMGLRVTDLGLSVRAERFISAAKAAEAQLVACLASLPGSMDHMKDIVEAAEALGLRNRIKIMIAGQPVTEGYRAAIGADFYAPDLVSAAEIAAAYCRRVLMPAA